MFDKMHKCLNNFEEIVKKDVVIKEDEESLLYFYLDFAKAMLVECPDVEKVAKTIIVEHGLFDDIKFKFSK